MEVIVKSHLCTVYFYKRKEHVSALTLLPQPRWICFHPCSCVGRLVCAQDYTKTTEWKLGSRMGI